MDLLRTTLTAASLIALTAAASAKPLTLPAETNLRAAPGTKSEVVTLMPQGSQVDIGECDAGWCKVKFGDKEGFAIGRNLGEGSPQTATADASRGRNPADLDRLRRGYEQYFDGNNRNDVTGSVDEPRYSQNSPQQYPPQQSAPQQYEQRYSRNTPQQYDPRYSQNAPQQYAAPRNARPQYNQSQYDDDDFDDDDDVPVVYSRPYVPGPPVYYSYGPRPRVHYDNRGYYYRRW
jgi:uncharacterized protein YraI